MDFLEKIKNNKMIVHFSPYIFSIYKYFNTYNPASNIFNWIWLHFSFCLDLQLNYFQIDRLWQRAILPASVLTGRSSF